MSDAVRRSPSDSEPVAVAALADGDAADALALLDASERAGGDVPLVDEAERRRLEGLARTGERADGWHPIVAHVRGEGVGYAAIAVADGTAVGDAAVAHDVAAHGTVLTALLAQLARTAGSVGASSLEVWVRHATDVDLEAAAAAGFTVERQLAILGGELPVPGDAGSVTPPPGVTIRASRPEIDDEPIVAVLAGAYGAGPDGGWDLPRFRERRQLDWFRPDDLLVAEDQAGRILGLHWLKRRSATVGEVHNLAVHPDAQGMRLGPVLLHAGLEHLTEIGCDEVLLWVDRANDRAVRLYTSQGLTTRWDDVALRGTPAAAPGPR